jgi:hypothetical protein
MWSWKRGDLKSMVSETCPQRRGIHDHVGGGGGGGGGHLVTDVMTLERRKMPSPPLGKGGGGVGVCQPAVTSLGAFF